MLETTRLILSPYAPDDVDALVLNADHQEVARMMASIPLPFTRDAATARIAQRQCDNSRFTFAMRLRDTGEMIGEIAAGSLHGTGTPQLGYFLRPDVWGQGFASEAIPAALDYGFRVLNWPVIEAETLDDNPASSRVLEKFGFARIGPSACTSLAREDDPGSTLHRLRWDGWCMPSLQTDRLTLRPRAMTDAERHAVLIDDYDVSKMLAVVAHPYPPEESRAWLSGALDDPRDAHFALDRGEGFMGVVSLSWKAPGVRRLGFWLGRPYWRHGYMAEATRAVVDWGFREMDIARIDSKAYLDNPGSLRIHALLGFAETARVRSFSKARGGEVEAATLILTREDWQT